jgi:hypothetical protein
MKVYVKVTQTQMSSKVEKVLLLGCYGKMSWNKIHKVLGSSWKRTKNHLGDKQDKIKIRNIFK